MSNAIPVTGQAPQFQGPTVRRPRKWGPFEVYPVSGEDPTATYVQVSLDSWICKEIDPTSKLTITGLDSPIHLDAPDSRQYIWLEVDLGPTYEDTPADPTCSIKHGSDWNAEGLGFFPSPVQYDTDDGTVNGSSGTPPESRKQLKFMVPIAYTVNPDSDPFGLAPRWGIPLAENVVLIQQLRSHLLLATTCSLGDSYVRYAIPWWAPFPDPDS